MEFKYMFKCFAKLACIFEVLEKWKNSQRRKVNTLFFKEWEV